MLFYNQPAVPISNLPDMSAARPDVVISEYAAYTSDMNIAKKTRGAYINGQFVYGVTPYILTSVTNSNGTAVFYITDNGTATGNPVFSMIPDGGVTIVPRGSSSIYQVSTYTISADMRSVTVAVTQMGSVALGLVSVVNAAANTAVDAIIWGKA